MIYQQLFIQKQDLAHKLQKVEAAIKALQEVCNHTDKHGRDAFTWRGNHAQYNIYQCTQCGHENKV